MMIWGTEVTTGDRRIINVGAAWFIEPWASADGKIKGATIVFGPSQDDRVYMAESVDQLADYLNVPQPPASLKGER